MREIAELCRELGRARQELASSRQEFALEVQHLTERADIANEHHERTTRTLLEHIGHVEQELQKAYAREGQQIELPWDGFVPSHKRKATHVGPTRHRDLQRFIEAVNRRCRDLDREYDKINYETVALGIGETDRTLRRTLEWHRYVVAIRRFMQAHPDIPVPIDLTSLSNIQLRKYADILEETFGELVGVHDILRWPPPWDIDRLA